MKKIKLQWKVQELSENINGVRGLLDNKLSQNAKLMDENRKLKEDMEKVIYSSEVGYKNQIISLQADMEYWKKEYENLSQDNYKILEVNKQWVEQVRLWRSKYEDAIERGNVKAGEQFDRNNRLSEENLDLHQRLDLAGKNLKAVQTCNQNLFNKIDRVTNELNSVSRGVHLLKKQNSRILDSNRLLQRKWNKEKENRLMWKNGMLDFIKMFNKYFND